LHQQRTQFILKPYNSTPDLQFVDQSNHSLPQSNMIPYSQYGRSMVMSPYRNRPIFEASDPPADRRDSERHHKTMLDYTFQKPLIMTPDVIKTRLPLEMIHESCNKACALYCIPNIPYAGPLASTARNVIFREVYNTWYVQNESCIVFGTFAAQLIGCWDDSSPKDVDGILKFHSELCTQVSVREKVLDDIDGLKTDNSPEVKCHHNFGLTPSFCAVVIIIDKEDWKNEGVLLVRTSDEKGLKTWPAVSSQGREQTESTISEKGMRLQLHEAVKYVLRMQLEVETQEEKALRLAPEVDWRTT